MRWYHYVAYFFGGAFLANAHARISATGSRGSPFQSPFASPARRRVCRRRTVNVLWGLLQPRRRLPARLPRRQLRPAERPQHVRSRSPPAFVLMALVGARAVSAASTAGFCSPEVFPARARFFRSGTRGSREKPASARGTRAALDTWMAAARLFLAAISISVAGCEAASLQSQSTDTFAMSFGCKAERVIATQRPHRKGAAYDVFDVRGCGLRQNLRLRNRPRLCSARGRAHGLGGRSRDDDAPDARRPSSTTGAPAARPRRDVSTVDASRLETVHRRGARAFVEHVAPAPTERNLAAGHRARKREPARVASIHDELLLRDDREELPFAAKRDRHGRRSAAGSSVACGTSFVNVTVRPVSALVHSTRSSEIRLLPQPTPGTRTT